MHLHTRQYNNSTAYCKWGLCAFGGLQPQKPPPPLNPPLGFHNCTSYIQVNAHTKNYNVPVALFLLKEKVTLFRVAIVPTLL